MKVTLVINPSIVLIPVIRAGTADAGLADRPVIAGKLDVLKASRNWLSARGVEGTAGNDNGKENTFAKKDRDFHNTQSAWFARCSNQFLR